MLWGKSAQKFDDEQDFQKKLVEQNERLIFILGSLAITVLLGSSVFNIKTLSELFNKKNTHMPATIRQFESLKKDSKIPTIDNCKSINQDLKSMLEL